MSTTTALRAGDLDRNATAELLGRAMAQGYLDVAEYDTRLQAVYDATTTPDLSRLTADLPLARLRRHDPRRRAAARTAARLHVVGYLAMVVTVLTVWLAVGLSSGSWYFWPIWPIAGAGLGLFAHLGGCPPARRMALRR
ncbi:DUF1707 domain-containing protein [Mycobacterium sp. pV006]|uniref:DUF1707 domain-containing protein n=1 Tax=Mycobacterium sp. pV006 TaxID=3238983 RepID=UPI00351AD559